MYQYFSIFRQRMPSNYSYFYRSPEHSDNVVLSFTFAFDIEEGILLHFYSIIFTPFDSILFRWKIQFCSGISLLLQSNQGNWNQTGQKDRSSSRWTFCNISGKSKVIYWAEWLYWKTFILFFSAKPRTFTCHHYWPSRSRCDRRQKSGLYFGQNTSLWYSFFFSDTRLKTQIAAKSAICKYFFYRLNGICLK